jgi:secreted trypsin-like serine protease
MAGVACSSGPESSVQVDSSVGIVGGREVAADDDWAAHVVAIWDSKAQFLCTGTLVARQIVMTAAHCLSGPPQRLKVLFARDVFALIDSKDPQAQAEGVRPVVSGRVHEQYRTSGQIEMDQNDLALLRFEGALPVGYQPAEVLNNSDALSRGQRVVMAGFGVSQVKTYPVDVEGTSRKKILKGLREGRIACDASLSDCVEVEMSGDGKLRMAEASIKGFTLRELRLDESQGQGTCSGDSGGPVFIYKDGKYFVIGVTSRGQISCDHEGIYTSTVEYFDWISDLISKL